MGPHYGGASIWERFWNRAIPEYSQEPRIKSYAKGGSFVTNGPQMIMVGDNPGGREAVNVVPLDSGEDKERSLPKDLWGIKRINNDYWNK